MIFYAHVQVALRRPPHAEEKRFYVVEAGCESDAYLLALQMSSCTSVMPVWAEIVGVEE